MSTRLPDWFLILTRVGGLAAQLTIHRADPKFYEKETVDPVIERRAGGLYGSLTRPTLSVATYETLGENMIENRFEYLAVSTGVVLTALGTVIRLFATALV